MSEDTELNTPDITVPDWDIDEPSESAMEKINGGCTSICPRCDGTGIWEGKICFSCGGTGWRR